MVKRLFHAAILLLSLVGFPTTELLGKEFLPPESDFCNSWRTYG
jgi:hypothetical protein